VIIFEFAAGRNGIVSEGAPWVAAQQAAEGQPATAEDAMGAQGVDGVVGAARVMAAARGASIEYPQHRGQGPLVDEDEKNEEPFHKAGKAAVWSSGGAQCGGVRSAFTISESARSANGGWKWACC